MGAAYLLALGFIVGLSGALIPGPLLVYTIAESMRRGWKTGAYVILGHAIVEVALMLVLVAGVSALMTSALFVKSISILGGAYMSYTAVALYLSRWDGAGGNTGLRRSVVAGGILFTALNPSFPLWWATAGARLLLEGLRSAGPAGAALVLIGHWGADFGWYTLVSTLVSGGRIVEGYVTPVKKTLSAILFAIGLYFISTGL